MNGIRRRQLLESMSLGGAMAFLQRSASGQQNPQTRALPRTFHYGPDNPSETYVKHAYDEQTVDLGEVNMDYVVAGNASSPALLLMPGRRPVLILLGGQHFHWPVETSGWRWPDLRHVGQVPGRPMEHRRLERPAGSDPARVACGQEALWQRS